MTADGIFCILLTSCVFGVRSSRLFTNDIEGLRASHFPKDFIFTTSTAAYQIEGAWNEGGKGENIWDRVIHSSKHPPCYIANCSTADVACDSYHKYKEDVKIIKNTGFSSYRFSIAWSRILPKGTDDYINEEGLQYYRNVIKELTSHGIEPMVTLYHWDLPQPLQDIGGWLNDTIIDYFQNYSRVVFRNFGDHVKWWVTVNEPAEVIRGYGTPYFPPNINLHGFGEYKAANNILKAHAKVYRMYEKEFKEKQKGKLSMSINGPFVFPKSNSSEDAKAADQAMQFNFGWFAHPIYSSVGDYPPVMRNIVDMNSLTEGLTQSRLPYFTAEEIEEIKGSYDFFAHNHYSSALGTFGTQGADPSVERDSNVILSTDPKWPSSKCSWLKVVPEGIRHALNWFRDQYGETLPIFITENGYCDDGRIHDFERISYYDSYLREMLKAITEDGCKVLGYTSWSIIDNFEWRDGYSNRFGLYYVDFSDPKRLRTKKLSAEYWQRFLLKEEK